MTSDEPEQPAAAEGSNPVPSDAKAPQETKANGPLVQVDIKASATDVFGLGAAAKTPAGEAVARGFFPALGYVLVSGSEWVFGRKNARTAAERIILEARANADASLITVQGEQRILNLKHASALPPTTNEARSFSEIEAERRLIAAGERIRTEEDRRQATIEAVLVEAVKLADKNSSDSQPSEIPEEFASKIINSAADASAPNVKSIYARLIASQVKPAPDTVSNPSLSLLDNLDGPLASALERFVSKNRAYGMYPSPFKTLLKKDRDQIEILREIGFLRTQYVAQYLIAGIEIFPRGDIFTDPTYDVLTLSVRGSEICKAVFDKKYIDKIRTENPIKLTEVLEDIESTINTLMEGGFSKVMIGVPTSNNKKCRLQISTKEAAKSALITDPTLASRYIENIDRMREFERTFDNQNSLILKGLIERYGIRCIY